MACILKLVEMVPFKRVNIIKKKRFTPWSLPPSSQLRKYFKPTGPCSWASSKPGSPAGLGWKRSSNERPMCPGLGPTAISLPFHGGVVGLPFSIRIFPEAADFCLSLYRAHPYWDRSSHIVPILVLKQKRKKKTYPNLIQPAAAAAALNQEFLENQVFQKVYSSKNYDECFGGK